MDRYIHYKLWVKDIDWNKLKFLDEAHFNELFKNYALGPIGQRIVVKQTQTLKKETYSMTLLSSLSNQPLPYFVSLRENSNTQEDFIKFIRAAIMKGFLTEGDFLILDGSSVHNVNSYLEELLKVAKITMYYLPAYSPELNPVELIWAYMKNYLRKHRGEEQTND